MCLKVYTGGKLKAGLRVELGAVPGWDLEQDLAPDISLAFS